MGLAFECPVHRGACMLGVDFLNPVDGGPPTTRTRVRRDGRSVPVYKWRRTGDSFDTLTLAPSIHVLEHDGGPTHWHGWIRNGEVT